MKTQELKEKNVSELEKLLKEKEENIRRLRFDFATKKVKGVRQIRAEKRDVARILTLIRQMNKQV